MFKSVSRPPAVHRHVRALARVSREVLQSIQEFVLPPVCLACERFLFERVSRICPSCSSAMAPVRDADPLYCEMRARLCGDGLLRGLASVFYFEKGGVLQTLIHQLKYEEMPVIGLELGKNLAVALAALLHTLPDAIIVPVPLHRTKLRERGYNQSDYIAQGISGLTGLPVHTHLLRRRRFTASQTRLTREERRANVHDAFEVKSNSTLSGLSFILVDDVITTGATIQECARVLHRHGAAGVYAASVALASFAAEQEA